MKKVNGYFAPGLSTESTWDVRQQYQTSIRKLVLECNTKSTHNDTVFILLIHNFVSHQIKQTYFLTSLFSFHCGNISSIYYPRNSSTAQRQSTLCRRHKENTVAMKTTSAASRNLRSPPPPPSQAVVAHDDDDDDDKNDDYMNSYPTLDAMLLDLLGSDHHTTTTTATGCDDTGTTPNMMMKAATKEEEKEGLCVILQSNNATKSALTTEEEKDGTTATTTTTKFSSGLSSSSPTPTTFALFDFSGPVAARVQTRNMQDGITDQQLQVEQVNKETTRVQTRKLPIDVAVEGGMDVTDRQLQVKQTNKVHMHGDDQRPLSSSSSSHDATNGFQFYQHPQLQRKLSDGTVRRVSFHSILREINTKTSSEAAATVVRMCNESTTTTALIDEEQWLLDAIAMDSSFPTLPSSAAAIYSQWKGEKRTSQYYSVQNMGERDRQRTKLWKPKCSWWAATSGHNARLEPGYHNKRWGYLWPLIHYHKFLKKCVRRLRSWNGDALISFEDDTTTSLSVSAFLRNEIHSVSDHLAFLSYLDSKTWVECLDCFYGWTDESNKKVAEHNHQRISNLKLTSMTSSSSPSSSLLLSPFFPPNDTAVGNSACNESDVSTVLVRRIEGQYLLTKTSLETTTKLVSSSSASSLDSNKGASSSWSSSTADSTVGSSTNGNPADESSSRSRQQQGPPKNRDHRHRHRHHHHNVSNQCQHHQQDQGHYYVNNLVDPAAAAAAFVSFDLPLISSGVDGPPMNCVQNHCSPPTWNGSNNNYDPNYHNHLLYHQYQQQQQQLQQYHEGGWWWWCDTSGWQYHHQDWQYLPPCPVPVPAPYDFNSLHYHEQQA